MVNDHGLWLSIVYPWGLPTNIGKPSKVWFLMMFYWQKYGDYPCENGEA